MLGKLSEFIIKIGLYFRIASCASGNWI